MFRDRGQKERETIREQVTQGPRMAQEVRSSDTKDLLSEAKKNSPALQAALIAKDTGLKIKQGDIKLPSATVKC